MYQSELVQLGLRLFPSTSTTRSICISTKCPMLTHRFATANNSTSIYSIDEFTIQMKSAPTPCTIPTISICYAEATDYEALHQLMTNPQIAY
jgi:hypothetical protein